jgi:hypothetical protein
MENINENLDSLNEAGNQNLDENLETTLEETDDVDVLKEKNRQLFARAKKAEGFVLKDGNWVKKVEQKLTEKPKENPPIIRLQDEDFQKKVGDTVIATLEKRDLDSLDYPEEIKKEISDYAKFKGISVKQASKATHIVPLIEQYEKAKATDEATISRTNKTGGTTKYSPDEPPDVDMSTPEGKKAYEEWFEQARKDPKYQPNIG